MGAGPLGPGLWGGLGLSPGGRGTATPMRCYDTEHSLCHLTGRLGDSLGTEGGAAEGPGPAARAPVSRASWVLGFRRCRRGQHPAGGAGARAGGHPGQGQPQEWGRTPSLAARGSGRGHGSGGLGPHRGPGLHAGVGGWPLCPWGAGTSWGPVPQRVSERTGLGGGGPPAGFQQLQAPARPCLGPRTRPHSHTAPRPCRQGLWLRLLREPVSLGQLGCRAGRLSPRGVLVTVPPGWGLEGGGPAWVPSEEAWGRLSP